MKKENEIQQETKKNSVKEFSRANPLFLSLVIVSILLELYGVLLVHKGYGFGGEPMNGSYLAFAAKELGEGVYPWNLEESGGDYYNFDTVGTYMEDDQIANAGDLPDGTAPVTGQENEGGGNADSSSANPVSVNAAVSGNGMDPSASENAAEEIYLPSIEPVDDSYFDDVLFIGDSRMVGVYEYAGIHNATFYAKTAMSIYSMMKSDVETAEGVSSVREGLENHQFGKIYIMVGVNELGTANTEYFINAYQNVLNEIMQLQPDAIIIIQAILHVSGEKSRTDRYINNDNINEKNEALSRLADGKRIFYLDVNPVFDDENGNLAADATGDQVHLYSTRYGAWKDFFYANGVVFRPSEEVLEEQRQREEEQRIAEEQARIEAEQRRLEEKTQRTAEKQDESSEENIQEMLEQREERQRALEETQQVSENEAQVSENEAATQPDQATEGTPAETQPGQTTEG